MGHIFYQGYIYLYFTLGQAFFYLQDHFQRVYLLSDPTLLTHNLPEPIFHLGSLFWGSTFHLSQFFPWVHFSLRPTFHVGSLFRWVHFPFKSTFHFGPLFTWDLFFGPLFIWVQFSHGISFLVHFLLGPFITWDPFLVHFLLWYIFHSSTFSWGSTFPYTGPFFTCVHFFFQPLFTWIHF